MMKQVHLKMPLRMLAALFGLILSASALGQQITVKGHVVDATGEGVIGATVRVNGTGGTVTDFDGNFTLQANQGDKLTVSYVGYKDATALAAPTVTIRMEDDTEALEEVVVIGYGRVKKNDLTGSVTALGADKLVKGAVTSATDMLVGQAAGVSVITDGGAPGGGATIRIRGGSSMSASNNPLVVIDGVPVDDCLGHGHLWQPCLERCDHHHHQEGTGRTREGVIRRKREDQHPHQGCGCDVGREFQAVCQ